MTHRSTSEPTTPVPDTGFGPWGHDEHSHPYGQLLYAIVGTCVLSCDGVAYPVGENRAVWLPPGLAHSARFAPGFAPLVVDTGTEMRHPTPLVLTVSAELRSVLIASLLTDDDPGELVVRELERVRSRPDLGTLVVAAPSGALTGPIAAALSADPGDPRTLEEWAHQLHAGSASIRRAFRDETGLAFSEWRTRRRLTAALELLQAGRPVSVVASRVGLTHHGLVAAFQRHLGRPPSSYAPTARPHRPRRTP